MCGSSYNHERITRSLRVGSGNRNAYITRGMGREGGGLCLGTKWRRGHKWHNMVVKQGRRMTGVGYTDWHCTPCFVHPLPLRLPANPPAPPRHPWKRCIYISIRSSFDPPYIQPIPVIKGANRFHGTRFLFDEKILSLPDPLFSRMIKFIRLGIRLEGSV